MLRQLHSGPDMLSRGDEIAHERGVKREIVVRERFLSRIASVTREAERLREGVNRGVDRSLVRQQVAALEGTKRCLRREMARADQLVGAVQLDLRLVKGA